MSDDKFLEFVRRRDWFLREWQVGVLPLDERYRHIERYGIDFAISAIRTGAILNGGALVLLPAYVALFEISPFASTYQLILAGCSFIAGLLCCWLASGGAYFASMYHALTVTDRREAVALKTHQSLEKSLWYETTPPPGNVTELTRSAERKDKICANFCRGTIGLLVLALLSFVIGTAFGGYSLIYPGPFPGPT